MIYLLNTFIIILSFVSMEGVAWLLHKYVMHGFLWSVHKDHHIPHNKKFERNDFFALVFGIPSWLFMQFGIMAGCDWRLYAGIGVTLYGLCYVLVHEGLIHGRIKIFRNVRNYRLLALRNGHKAHHTHDKDADYKKENDVCYGMLWVPMKYFREAKIQELRTKN
jgi:beta-carotene 3-hydroxylase